MSALGDAQRYFPRLVAKLIEHAYAAGYELTLGEAWRPPEAARYYAEHGCGIVNSLHIVRLAIDVNLFRDGAYLTAASDYAPLGDFWASLDPACRWGGTFESPDADHFSYTVGDGRA